MALCEHCKVDPVEVKKEVTTALEGRIKDLTDRNKELKTVAEQATTKAKDLEGKLGELTARDQEAALKAAEGAGGWTFDDRGRKWAKAAYEEAVADKAEAERPSFADWLASDEAKGDVLLAGWRKPDGTPTPAKDPKPPGKTPPTPPADKTPSTPVKGLTADQVKAEAAKIMAGAGTPAEKRVKLDELKAQSKNSN